MGKLAPWILAPTLALSATVSGDDASARARELLRKWTAAGTAAGHAGDFYDNRDGGHSPLNLENHPGLQPLPYTEEERAGKKNHGPAAAIRPETVIGNASLSGSAVGGASIPRLFLGTREGIGFLAGQYLANQLYVYPEHQDHDPSGVGLSGYGDLYAVNSPYLVISQGSSGSDLPFAEAVAMTLASFRPEVKEALRQRKLLMPVVQQILRSSLTTVATREDYLTCRAHPTVFSAEWLDLEGMMRRAQSMTEATLPPVFHLQVTGENPPPRPGVDFFESSGRVTESLADEGMVIARVFRGMARERELVLRVARADDWTGRPLRIHWRVLRGDPDLVTLEPSSEKPEATLRVGYHAGSLDAPGPSGLKGRRVDILAVADNGETFSPPCFVCFYFLPNERRHYDAEGRILRTEYGFEGAFTDITLTSSKNWSDHYHYDEGGALSGWTRVRPDTAAVEFDAEGRRIEASGPVSVSYNLDPASHRLVVLPAK